MNSARRHVIKRNFDLGSLSQMASYDVGSTIHQSLWRGHGYWNGRYQFELVLHGEGARAVERVADAERPEGAAAGLAGAAHGVRHGREAQFETC